MASNAKQLLLECRAKRDALQATLNTANTTIATQSKTISDQNIELAALESKIASLEAELADCRGEEEPPPPPPPPPPSEGLREVDGGINYYAQFSNPLPSDPSFFPIGVWFESVLSQGDIDKDKDAGLNTYVVLTGNSNLSLIQQNGMYAIPQQSEWKGNTSARNNPNVVAWELHDEIDMQQGPNGGYTTLQNILASLPNDGRARYNNYGKGVMFWETDSQASQFVNNYNQLISNDIYWFTDPNLSSSAEGPPFLQAIGESPTLQRAANYGYTVDRMRYLDGIDGKRKPIWNFVEVGWPFTETAAQGARNILPQEIRAAVWHSIIAGARGIIYFNHSFGGPNISQHCLRESYYANQRAAVKATNAQIKQLAPVLNSHFDDSFVSVNTTRIRTMTKLYNNEYYIFAGNKDLTSKTASFTVRSGSTVTVVGENRTLSLSNKTFTDTFADGNAIHIYKVS